MSVERSPHSRCDQYTRPEQRREHRHLADKWASGILPAAYAVNVVTICVHGGRLDGLERETVCVLRPVPFSALCSESAVFFQKRIRRRSDERPLQKKQTFRQKTCRQKSFETS